MNVVRMLPFACLCVALTPIAFGQGALTDERAEVEGTLTDEQAELERTLREFLSAADQRAAHEVFWAEDLIYTSSSGERYGLAEILSSFDEPDQSGPPAPDYGAEDATIRVLGDLAVVTFRLTADRDGARVGEYFNTGVFRREPDGWKAFTWQATRIPAADSD